MELPEVLFKNTIICSVKNVKNWVDIVIRYNSIFKGYKVVSDIHCSDYCSYIFDENGQMRTETHV